MLPLYLSHCSDFKDMHKKKERHEKKKYYEIFFRHVFTSTWPHKPAGAPDDREFAIAVTQLSHITHDKEEREIITSSTDDGFYKMLPSRKVGKAYKYDGSPLGESFRDDFRYCNPLPPPDKQFYKYISDRESLMPEGYYSWWGVKTEAGRCQEHFQKKKKEVPSLPPYLLNLPESWYGNNEFSGDLNNLLQSYQDSRVVKDKPKPDIYLLAGGTLRYKFEICCVVIVCTADDKESGALKDYKPVTTEPEPNDPTLNLNGLTDGTGKVIDLSGTKQPTFCPKFLSSESWANLAFAFYYDSGTGCLSISTKDLRRGPIEHPHCVKTKPVQGRKGWVCPNVTDNPAPSSMTAKFREMKVSK